MNSSSSSIPASRYAIFASVAIIGAAVDLWTKHAVFQSQGFPGFPNSQGIWWLWEPYIGVQTAVNEGALFGMGAGYGVWFAVLSVVAAIGIVYWLFAQRAATDLLLTVALACVMAGIFGNLYDRLGLWWQPGMPEKWSHGVRDWILFRFESFTWPNFNIADSMLLSGACLLAWHAFVTPDPEKDAAD